MFFSRFQRAVDTAITFLRDQSGSILIYTGAFMAIGVGGAALSIDIGRIVLLKTQMQNRADAGALAGAAQLDAQANAIERSDAVVKDSMFGYTTAGADQTGLGVYSTAFYAVDLDDPSRTKRGLVTANDALARFVAVNMDRRTLSFFYGPALNIMTGQDASNFTYLDARAVGMSDPFICKMQPMMICNPFDDGDPGTKDATPADDAYKGFGMRIKTAPGGDSWGPGNFGLLNLPYDAEYELSGAKAVEAALAADEPLGCYSVNSLSTATGTPAKAVMDGINVRWTGPNVAPNAKNYPRDDDMIADPTLNFAPSGGGAWDITTYWNDFHPGVVMPVELAGATRYLVYLFEQGVVFWAKNGGKTLAFTLDESEKIGGMFPVDVATFIADPVYAGLESPPGSGLALPVNAAADDNDLDGVPKVGEAISTKAHKRRVVTIAVANCLDVVGGFQGTSELPADGVYIDLFLTEEAGTTAEGVPVYGEIIKAVEARTSLEFHGNVRLVE